jgi:hypothetical protein
MADDEKNALVPTSGGGAWSGDDHRLAVSAAKEAGLDTVDLEVESYTEGFKQGLILDDPADHAIVIRGRTVLKEKQLRKSLSPTLRFLRLSQDVVGLRVHDGNFELRIARTAAEQAAPAMDSAKVALQVWVAAGLIGYALGQLFAPLSGIIWGAGLLGGAWVLRQGLVSGRSLLAARMLTSLAMMAQEEQLVLPPNGEQKPA